MKPKNCLYAVIIFFLAVFVQGPAAFAYPYPTDDFVDKDDPAIQGWATGWQDYLVGSEVKAEWQTPEKALGKAVGDSYDIVSLGRGGSIIMTFDRPIINGPGADFAIFENSFSDDFLELAWVEVSSDGEHFVRFDNNSLTREPVGGFGTVDAGKIYQLAGKHKQGKGTLFDLDMLQWNVGDDPSILDLDNIRYIRLVDIVGNATCFDTWGSIIYDPYPTTESAGFDLDAIGVLNQGILVIAGDFYMDDDVDGSDIDDFICLFSEKTDLQSDLNGDGTIDSGDLEKFAENFGKAL